MITTLFFMKANAMNLFFGAQTVDGVYIFPKYAMIIFSGVVLSLLFQFIFVILSVSLGISSLGDLRKKFVKASNHTDGDDNSSKNSSSHFSQDYGHNGPGTAEGISTAFGIWSMITTSLALFLGTILALNLATISTIGINISLALVIWAIFFLILFYMEMKLAQTVVGGLFSTVVGAMKKTSNTIQKMFATSETDKIEHTLDHSIEKVRKELVPEFDTEKIKGVLEKFFKKVDNKLPDYETLKNDIQKTVESSGSTNNSNSATKWMAVQQIISKVIDEKGNGGDNSASLQKLAKEIKDNVQREGSVKEGAEQVISNHSKYSKEDIKNAVQKVKDYIGKAVPSNFEVDNIKEEIRKISDGDETLIEALTGKSSISRDDVIDTLKRNTNVSEDKLEDYADTVMNSIDGLKENFSKKNLEDFKNKIERQIKEFLNMSPSESFDIKGLKTEFVQVLNHPSEAFENVKNAISSYNRKDFENFLTDNNLVSHDKIDAVAEQYHAAIDEVKEKVDEIEIKARQAYEMTKRKAVIQAEHARKTAAIAAWWLLFTILIAGATSVLGVYFF